MQQLLADYAEYTVVDRVGEGIEVTFENGESRIFSIDEFMKFANTIAIAHNELVDIKELDQ